MSVSCQADVLAREEMTVNQLSGKGRVTPERLRRASHRGRQARRTQGQSTRHKASTVCTPLQSDGTAIRRTAVEQNQNRRREAAPYVLYGMSEQRAAAHCQLPTANCKLQAARPDSGAASKRPSIFAVPPSAFLRSCSPARPAAAIQCRRPLSA